MKKVQNEKYVSMNIFIYSFTVKGIFSIAENGTAM